MSQGSDAGRGRVLLAEDDPIMGESLQDRLAMEGYEVDWVTHGEQARQHLLDKEPSLVLCDIRLPDILGAELLDSLSAGPDGQAVPPILFITGYGTVDEAVDLLKRGATDYITKPFDIDELVHRAHSLCRDRGGECPGQGDEAVLGRSPVMCQLQATLPRVARYEHPVLISGESGVGKEHVAGFLRACNDPEQNKPFLSINCGAIAPELLESELFGHEKGAFTGAHQSHKGLFERARGGILFLDEVGEMPLSMQVKLLRVIQSGEFFRVGAERPQHSDAWLVFATNRDLQAMVEAGEFREDLYYRINVVQLRVPPLRERREDILWFAHRFLREFAEAHPEEEPRYLLPSAERALQGYSWPGNLRELKNCLHRACILSTEQGLNEELLHLNGTNGSTPAGAELPVEGENLREQIESFERRILQQALEANDYRMQATADSLGITRKNLWEKLKKAGLKE